MTNWANDSNEEAMLMATRGVEPQPEAIDPREVRTRYKVQITGASEVEMDLTPEGLQAFLNLRKLLYNELDIVIQQQKHRSVRQEYWEEVK